MGGSAVRTGAVAVPESRFGKEAFGGEVGAQEKGPRYEEEVSNRYKHTTDGHRDARERGIQRALHALCAVVHRHGDPSCGDGVAVARDF